MKSLLIINPGSTSTKIAVFRGAEAIFTETISHSAEELSPYINIIAQKDFRQSVVSAALSAAGFDGSSFQGLIGIGGLLRSVESGVYEISDDMLADLTAARYGEHAANLGAVLVRGLADAWNVPGYIADPITVDEMQDVARISGHPLLPRYGRTHTLNHKRVAMSAAAELGKSYEDCRFVVAHLGGGVSIGAHCGGRIIDSTTSRGEGAFSMDRSGQLNSWELAKLCFSGKYEKQEVLKMLNGNGGVCAYLNTRDFRDVERMMKEGNPAAYQVFHGLAYQVSKEIASMAAVLCGRLDGIILTGGIAFSQAFVDLVTERAGFLGRIILKPGEEEMESLAYYLDAALRGALPVKTYEAQR